MRELAKNSRIFVAGHRGLVGSAVVRRLEAHGFSNILVRSRAELDLRNAGAVEAFFRGERPDAVFLAAAKVGGILANDRFRGDFILENLEIQTNVIGSAFRHGVEKLVFFGSSCIYPKLAPQPIREDALLTGPLEPTNEAYAVAKIAGLMLCKSLAAQYGRRFVAVMPTNLYGPNDNYHPENSHVIPGLLRRFHEAKTERRPSVACWGTGAPLREFLYSDDCADAAILALERYEELEHLNVGSGSELSIRELVEAVRKVVGYEGEIAWDTSKPDGTPRKLMDSSRLFALGFRPRVDLEEGLRRAYADFLARSGERAV